MPLTQAQTQDAYRFFALVFNAAPGVTYMNQIADAYMAGATTQQIVNTYTTKPQFQSVYPNFLSNQAFATNLVNNVVGNTATQAAKDQAVADIVAALNGGSTRGDVIYTVFTNLANKSFTDPEWGNTAKMFANKVAVAQYVTETKLFDSTNLSTLQSFLANVAPSTDTSTPAAIEAALQGSALNQGQTFTLTTGIDIKNGTDGSDTFDGSVNANGVATLTSVDQLDGKGGIDYLIAGLAGGNIAAKLSNIENAEFITSVPTTLDLVNTSGLETVTMRNSSANLTVQNIGSTTSPSFKIQDQAADVNLLFANSALTGTNSFTLELNGAQSDGTGGADVLLQQQAGSDTSGLEELVIQSKGSGRNFLDSIDGQNAANTSTLSKLTVAGNQGLTVATNFAAGVRTIDLSGMTGEGLTAGFAAVQAVTVTGSGGADILTFGANNANSSIAAGAGNDVISIANFNANDSIDGGDGTDRLDISAADAEAVTANLANTVNFEQLSLNTAGTAGSSVNATRFGSGINTVRLDQGTNGAYTVTLNAGSQTLTLAEPAAATNAQLGGALTINDTGTATTDVLTITNRDTDTTSATDNFNGQAITVNGFETVTINTGSTATTGQTVGNVTLNNDSLSGANTLNISGANGLTFTSVVSNSSGLLTIDASGLTGQAALTMVVAPTFSVSNGTVRITGSANADTLLGHGTIGSTIDGGSGADTITGGSGADSIVGGAGNDNITGGGGNDTITGDAGNDTIDVSGVAGAVSVSGGAGNDVVIVNGTLTATDTIAGGDDTDTLQITAAATAATAANVSGFEVLRLSAGLTQGMEQFINNTGFTEVQFDAAGNITVTNAGASVNTLRVQDSGGGNTFTFARLVDTATNALTVYVEDTGGNAQTVATLTANDEETLTFNTGTTSDATANNGTGEALTITTLNAADLTSLTVTGQNAFTITNAIGGAANLATISATGLTANFSVNASTSTANMTVNGSNTGSNTITTGTGNDTITGGTAADAITGGNGEDVIYGGAGADGLTGGLGADQIFGEIGNDTLTGGAGNDTLTGGDGADVFVFGSADTILGGNNGVDRILDFVSGTDDIDVTNGLLNAVGNSVVTTTAGNTDSITIADNDVHYISMNGAAANLTTGGNATLSASDLTATTLTNLAAYLDERFVTANTAGNDAIFVINWTAGGSTTSYIYEFTDAGGNTTIEAAELALVGIVSRGDTVLTIGDIV